MTLIIEHEPHLPLVEFKGEVAHFVEAEQEAKPELPAGQPFRLKQVQHGSTNAESTASVAVSGAADAAPADEGAAPPAPAGDAALDADAGSSAGTHD